MKAKITISLSTEILDKLRREAKANRRSVSNQLDVILAAKLEKIENKIVPFRKVAR